MDATEARRRRTAERTETERPSLVRTVGFDDRVSVRRQDDPKPSTLAAWDALVERTPGTDVTQMSAWSDIRALACYAPTYLFAYRGDQLAGGALLLRRRLFGATVAYLPYGPLVGPDQPGPAEVTVALVDELTKLASGWTMTFVQPPENSSHLSKALLARGFRTSSACIAPTGSYRVDLSLPLEEIRARFSKRLKSWTNRWPAKGVTVRRGDERDLPLLMELMTHTGARQGFRPPPMEYVQTLYHRLAADGHAALFVGEVDGKPVSADVVTVAGGMVRGRLGGFDGTSGAGKLSVPAAVRWEIIQWGKERGYRWLDFGGLPDRMLTDMIDRGIHTSDEWPNAQRGKLAFGGRPFRYPTPVELIRPAPVRLAYDLAKRTASGRRTAERMRELLRGNQGKLTDPSFCATAHTHKSHGS